VASTPDGRAEQSREPSHVSRNERPCRCLCQVDLLFAGFRCGDSPHRRPKAFTVSRDGYRPDRVAVGGGRGSDWAVDPGQPSRKNGTSASWISTTSVAGLNVPSNRHWPGIPVSRSPPPGHPEQSGRCRAKLLAGKWKGRGPRPTGAGQDDNLIGFRGDCPMKTPHGVLEHSEPAAKYRAQMFACRARGRRPDPAAAMMADDVAG